MTNLNHIPCQYHDHAPFQRPSCRVPRLQSIQYSFQMPNQNSVSSVLSEPRWPDITVLCWIRVLSMQRQYYCNSVISEKVKLNPATQQWSLKMITVLRVLNDEQARSATVPSAWTSNTAVPTKVVPYCTWPTSWRYLLTRFARQVWRFAEISGHWQDWLSGFLGQFTGTS